MHLARPGPGSDMLKAFGVNREDCNFAGCRNRNLFGPKIGDPVVQRAKCSARL